MHPLGLSQRNNKGSREALTFKAHLFWPQSLRKLRFCEFGWSGVDPHTLQPNLVEAIRRPANLFQHGPASNRQAPIRAIPVPSPTRIDRLRRQFMQSATELARAEPSGYAKLPFAVRTRARQHKH